jgi:hypothetical protein
MTYNHTERTLATILFPPHGTDSTGILKEFLSHLTLLDMDADPFVVHLLYLSRAAIDWRKVLQDITNELMHHVNLATSPLRGSVVDINFGIGTGKYGGNAAVWSQDGPPATKSWHCCVEDPERDSNYREYNIRTTPCTRRILRHGFKDSRQIIQATHLLSVTI